MKPKFRNEKGTAGECRALFASSKAELRWLCYTLTGDTELSDKAMDAALQQSLKGASQVFREWMSNWARRLIIKFCIAIVKPAEAPLVQSASPLFPVNFGEVSMDNVRALLGLPPETLQQKLMQLDALSRFVFVLRALEGYKRRDTAVLLSIDDRACEWIYGWAASRLASEMPREATKQCEVISIPAPNEFRDHAAAFEYASAI